MVYWRVGIAWSLSATLLATTVWGSGMADASYLRLLAIAHLFMLGIVLSVGVIRWASDF